MVKIAQHWVSRARCDALGLVLLALCLTLTGPGSTSAIADSRAGTLTRTVVNAANYPWSAIGRINIAGFRTRAHCAGSLVSERLVLTAAHCLYIEPWKKWIEAPRVHFVAGFQRGEYVGHSTAVRYVVSKSYDIASTEYQYRPQDDWALVELREPIGSKTGYLGWAVLDSAGLGSALQSGARVALAGYPGTRQYVMSVTMECRKPHFGNGHALFFHRCASMKGDSGGPVLLLMDGKVTIVAVLSGGQAGQSYSVPVASFHRTILGLLGGDGSLDDMDGLAGLPGWSPDP